MDYCHDVFNALIKAKIIRPHCICSRAILILVGSNLWWPARWMRESPFLHRKKDSELLECNFSPYLSLPEPFWSWWEAISDSLQGQWEQSLGTGYPAVIHSISGMPRFGGRVFVDVELLECNFKKYWPPQPQTTLTQQFYSEKLEYPVT